MTRTIAILVVLTVICLMMFGCSGSVSNNPATVPLPERMTDTDGHALWGLFRIYIDPSIPSVDIVPLRQASMHANVKPYLNPPSCNDCVTLVPTGPYSGNILPVNITLKNPTPLTGYDVRGILLSDDPGAYLMNPDNYTDLFDNGGAVNINPFRAFAKVNADRSFGAGEEYTEPFQIYLSGFGKVAVIDYAVDASWPGRAKEPYALSNMYINGALDDLDVGEATLQIEVFASGDDVDEVLLDVSSLGFSEELSLVNSYGDVWEITFGNDPLAPQGDYECWLRASTSSSNKYLYHKFTLTVVEGIPPISLADDIQPIFDANCITCHQSVAPPLDLDLTTGNTYSNTVGVQATQSVLNIVEPFGALESYLVGKVLGIQDMPPFDGSGQQMPSGDDPLGPDDANLIIQWVSDGALDN
jgi:hypothetical protein